MLEWLSLFAINSVMPNILNNFIYDAGKTGVKKIFKLDSKEELSEILAKEFEKMQMSQKYIELLMEQMVSREEMIAKYLKLLTTKLGMETTILIEKQGVIIEASPKDSIFREELKKQTQNSPLHLVEQTETISTLGINEETILDMEERLSNLKLDVERVAEQIKKAIIMPRKTVEPNRIFKDWFDRNIAQKGLVYEITKSGFYSFSRQYAKNELLAQPQFYISDKRGEKVSLAIYSEKLSDDNNIVLKVDIDNGYIFAINKKIIL